MPRARGRCQNVAVSHEKLEWWSYQLVKKLRICAAISIQYTKRDRHAAGQTDGHRAMA